MTNEEAKVLVKEVFASIRCAKSSADLEKIIENNSPLQKNKFDTSKYPNLRIFISADDIATLKKLDILSTENRILPLADPASLTPLEKLLYSILWKNGDLGKETHIVEGAIAALEGQDNYSKENGLVFYQFGKHLAQREEPIVDQHTIRAFLLFQNLQSDDLEITKIRKNKTIKIQELLNFKSWLNSCEIEKIEHQFHIDKILFSLGKSIKIKTK